jgi:hypothetical protein
MRLIAHVGIEKRMRVHPFLSFHNTTEPLHEQSISCRYFPPLPFNVLGEKIFQKSVLVV